MDDCIWILTFVFTDVESEMRGLEWGRLYEEHHKQPKNQYMQNKQEKLKKKVYQTVHYVQ